MILKNSRQPPAGWRSMASVACQTRLTLMTPMSYRHIIRFSRTAWCSACASGRSQPCYSSLSPFVGRSVGGPRHAPTAGKRPVPASPPAQAPSGLGVAAFSSVRGGARRDARERPPTPPRVASACDNAYRLINAPQSLKPKGFSVTN